MSVEFDKLKKIEILTKIAGALKKAGDQEGTLSAGNEAYELCQEVLGERDY